MAYLPLIHIGMLPTDGVVGDRLRHGRPVVGRVLIGLRPFLHARLARKCGLGREPSADRRHRSWATATFWGSHLRTHSASRDGQKHWFRYRNQWHLPQMSSLSLPADIVTGDRLPHLCRHVGGVHPPCWSPKNAGAAPLLTFFQF